MLSRRLSVFLLGCSAVLAMRAAGWSAEAEPVPLSLERVEPNTGPVSGGTRISILGWGFDTSDAAPIKVVFGGQASLSVTVHSGTKITAVTPAGQAGAVDVEVENGEGRKASLGRAFCYDAGGSWLARWYRAKAWAESFWVLMKQGGVIMIVLGVLSVLGLAWAIHCALVLRPGEIMPRPFLERLSGHISRQEISEAVEVCQKDRSVFGRIAMAALRKAGEPVYKVREAAQATGSREGSHLLQKISYLSNIGVISPMLGLLGTVVGMVLAFKTLGIGEAGSRHILLAEAIYKALITTVGGLVVGIPAMACFYYLRGKLLWVLTEMEQVTEEIADAIAASGERE